MGPGTQCESTGMTDHRPASRRDSNAEPIPVETWPCVDRRRGGRNDFGRYGRKKRIRRNDLPTFEFTVLQYQRHPSSEIVCRRTDATRRRLWVGQTLILRLEAVADLHVT